MEGGGLVGSAGRGFGGGGGAARGFGGGAASGGAAAGCGLLEDAYMEEIRRCISEIRFGSVTAVIHEGRVVQVEKQEKIRFDA